MTVKNSRLLIVVAIVLLATILPSLLMLNFNSYNNESNQLTSNLSGASNVNTQEYIVNKETGEKRTIYWAPGVDAPKMASDGEVVNPDDRYFKKDESTAGGVDFLKYYYPMEEGKGYYDFNKNPTRAEYPQQNWHHCYLAAALNQIYWWLDNNKYYVDRYLEGIVKGDYEQREDLHPINDMEMWARYRKTPPVEFVENRGFYGMELSNNPLYKEVFRVYHDRDMGYWSDMVWDNFFNGYFHYSPREGSDGYAPPNKVSDWRPGKNAGFFYNLLGKEPISRRQTVGSYEMFSELVKENILAGNGIVINYLGAGVAHAITLWGAEFDEKGMLKRVYLTDSDDYDPAEKKENDHIIGMYANNIIKDSIGNARLSTRVDMAKDEGVIIHEVAILSLAQDRLELSLQDKSAPIAPKFEVDLHDQAYTTALDEARSLEVKVKREDKGDYMYKWFVSSTNAYNGEEIKTANKSWYTPPIPSDGTSKYYYCEVTNIKNGKMAKSKSKIARVYVDPNVTHAKKPTAKLKDGTKRSQAYTQYTQPKPIIAEGYSLDGGEISYQWYHYTNREEGVVNLLEGETSNVFYPNNLWAFEPDGSAVFSHYYYCVVTNTNNTVTGNPIETAQTPTVEVYVDKKATFKQALNPVIIKELPPQIEEDFYGELPAIEVSAKSVDQGNLSYQWYMATDEYSEGVKINNATLSSYKPKKQDGNKYYYCAVTNNNENANIKQSNVVTTSRVKANSSIIASTDNNLYDLTITKGTLTPSFKSEITTYSLSLPYNEASTTISATSSPTAKVTGLGSVTLLEGESKVVNIVVKAESGDIKTYKITISRDKAPYIPSSIATLSSIVLSQGTLTPNFNKDVYAYSVTLAHNVDRTTISASATSDKAVIEGLGQVSLANGESKVVTLTVTAEDKVSKKEYQITISRDKVPYVPSTNAYLSSLTVNEGKLSPSFNKDIFSYTLALAHDKNSVVISATSESDKASIEGVGAYSVEEGQSKQVKVIVLAEDGVSAKTYSITITRESKPVSPEVDPEPENPEVNPNPQNPDSQTPEIVEPDNNGSGTANENKISPIAITLIVVFVMGALITLAVFIALKKNR